MNEIKYLRYKTLSAVCVVTLSLMFTGLKSQSYLVEPQLDVLDKSIDLFEDDEHIKLYCDFIISSCSNKLRSSNKNCVLNYNEYALDIYVPQDEDERSAKIKTLKIAYLSSRLNFTLQESEKFWPIYNLYIADLKSLSRFEDEVDKEEEMVKIKKKYKVEFIKVVGLKKCNTLFKSEKEFKNLIQESLILKKVKDQSKEQF